MKKSSGDCIFNPTLRKRQEITAHREITLAPLESRPLTDFPLLPELTAEHSGGCFENKFFRCTYTEKGRIVSLKSAGGREMVDGTSAAWFGLPVMQMDAGDNWLLYEAPLNGGSDAAAFTANRPDPLYREPAQNGLVNRTPFFAEIDRAEIHRSVRECVITQQGHLQFWQLRVDFTLTVCMDDLSPILKYRLDIRPSGKHYRLRAAFPTALAGETVHHGIPGGVQERNNCEYPAEGFMHLGNASGGLFLLNCGIPGNNTDENGVMMLSLFRSVAMEYKCPSEGSFNIGVPHTFEYAVLPHDGEMYASETAAIIETYLRPLQAAPGECKCSLPELPANVRILSLRKHPQGFFLRLGEVWGKSARYDLSTPYIPAAGLERPIDTETEKVLDFRPFEIRNILVRELTAD